MQYNKIYNWKYIITVSIYPSKKYIPWFQNRSREHYWLRGAKICRISFWKVTDGQLRRLTVAGRGSFCYDLFMSENYKNKEQFKKTFLTDEYSSVTKITGSVSGSSEDFRYHHLDGFLKTCPISPCFLLPYHLSNPKVT